MASVLIFNNFLLEGQKSILEPLDTNSNITFESTGPGKWQVNPYSQKKHMTIADAFNKVMACFLLYIKARKYDVLILDSATSALFIGVFQTIWKIKTKIIVASFNVPRRRKHIWKYIGRLLLSHVDFIFVHSRTDIDICKRLYNFSEAQVSFRPFVRSAPSKERQAIDGLPDSILDTPFILSMGSNGRDYRTLLEAVDGLEINVVIVARKYNVEGLHVPKNTTLLFDLKLSQCDYLTSKCLFTVFTFDGSEPSCGQISFVSSYMLGKPVICTKWMGAVDYVINGVNGLHTEMSSSSSLREAIATLHNDKQLYSTLATGANKWASKSGSAEVARALIYETTKNFK